MEDEGWEIMKKLEDQEQVSIRLPRYLLKLADAVDAAAVDDVSCLPCDGRQPEPTPGDLNAILHADVPAGDADPHRAEVCPPGLMC